MRLALQIVAIMFSGPALAAATDWQELAPDTHIRLIASERLDNGRSWLALELDLPPGTKTYWRVPGETGIPLQLDLGKSHGIVDQRLAWPFPAIEIKDGYTDFVHYGPTVIPVEVTVAGSTAQVEASVLLGVCSDICVPAMASFSLPLDFTRPDAGQALRIDQAIAMTSIEWSGGDAPVGDVSFDAESGELTSAVDMSRLDPDTLIVDANQAGYVFGAPQKSPEPNLVLHQVLGGGTGDTLVGKDVTLVFMTSAGPYEVTRRVLASSGG